MRTHTVDYLAQDGRRPGRRERVSRGFWIHDVPRPLLACRALGHKPVINGTPGVQVTDTVRWESGARWVECARCGVRPEPQGYLDPAVWKIGQLYTGTFTDHPDDKRPPKTATPSPEPTVPPLDGQDPPRLWSAPGPWPKRLTGTIGGQLVIGHGPERIGASVKVGNGGSEHTLAGDIAIPFLGALYLHTENIGRGVQQRLNPVGYESKVIELGISTMDWALRWRLWAPRDSHSATTPRWKDGYVSLDLAERVLGPKRYSYTRQGLPVMGLVRMPEGDDHQVRLTLKRQTLARSRPANRQPLEEKWTVEWSTRAGIPFRQHSWKGDCVYGSSVYVSDQAVEQGRWILEACAAIAAKVAADRTRYRWKPADPDIDADASEPTDPDLTYRTHGVLTIRNAMIQGLETPPAVFWLRGAGTAEEEWVPIEGTDHASLDLGIKRTYVIDPAPPGADANLAAWAREQLLTALELGATNITVYTDEGGDLLLGLIRSTWQTMQDEGIGAGRCVTISKAVHNRSTAGHVDHHDEQAKAQEPDEHREGERVNDTPAMPCCTEIALDHHGNTMRVTAIPADVVTGGTDRSQAWADALFRYARDARADAVELADEQPGPAHNIPYHAAALDLLTEALQDAWQRHGGTEPLQWSNRRARLTWPTPDTADTPAG